jgi:hypothetical protein
MTVSHLAAGQVDNLPFLRVLGESTKAGTSSNLYTYTAYVERGLPVNKLEFVAEVHAILADKRGWTRSGKYSFKRVPRYGNTQLVLATPATVDKLCAPLRTEGKVSCNQGSKVVINIDRWLQAVPHWLEAGGSVHTYRQMVINHEFGHRIGQNHRYCPGAGLKAPVMQQQTYGFQGCRRNSWPLSTEL